MNYENEHFKCCFFKLTLILRCFGSLNKNNNKKYNNTQNAHVFVKYVSFHVKLHNLHLHVTIATVSYIFLITTLCYRVKHTKELELTFHEDFFHSKFKNCFLMSIFISPITTETTHSSKFKMEILFFREHLSNPGMTLQ